MLKHSKFLIFIFLLVPLAVYSMNVSEKVKPQVVFEISNETDSSVGFEYLISPRGVPFYTTIDVEPGTVKSIEYTENFNDKIKVKIVKLPRSTMDPYLIIRVSLESAQGVILGRDISLMKVSATLESIKFSPPTHEMMLDKAFFYAGRSWDTYIIKIKVKGQNLEKSTLVVNNVLRSKPIVQ